MKRHHSLIAIMLVLVMAGVAALGFRGFSTSPVSPIPEPLIPDLAAKAESITSIELLAGQTDSLLIRQGDRFVLPGQGNLPVPVDKVRQLLNQLAQVQLLEAKTDDPARYEQLGVGPVKTDPAAREIRLLSGPKTVLADVFLGKTAPTLARLGGGLYVRRAAEAQSWLAEGQVDLPTGPGLWTGGPLFPLANDQQIKMITLSDNGERVIEAMRSAPNQLTFQLQPELPQPDQARLGRLAALPATLAGSDSKPLLAGAKPVRIADFQAFDGTTYRLALYPQGKELWARASMQDGPDPMLAKQFTVDHAGALNKLPDAAAALLNSQPADFAQLGEPAARPAAPVPVVKPVAHGRK